MSGKKTIILDRFNNQNGMVAKNYYNVLPTSTITNSMHVEDAVFPSNYDDDSEYSINLDSMNVSSIDGINYFKQYFPQNGYTIHRLLLHGSDKKIYMNELYADDPNLYWIYHLKFDSAPITLTFKQNDTDAIILADKNVMKIWKTNYTPYTIENTPVITSMCIQDNVLFCTVVDPAFKVWYCTDFNAENVGSISSYSDYITLGDELGYSRKIVSFNDGVYVFRDYGITKISFYKKSYIASQVYQSNTKIYSNTVAVCGDMIVFATGEGLYSYGGSKVSKLNINLGEIELKNLKSASVSSLGSKYFIACKINYNDASSRSEENANNVILYIDIEDLSVGIIRGVNTRSFLPIKTETYERMYVLYSNGENTKIGQLIEHAESKVKIKNEKKNWISYDLNKNQKSKLFTKLKANCSAGICFKLHYDGKTKDFVSYKDGINQFTFRLPAQEFYIEVVSVCSNINIENIAIDYYEE